MAVLCDTQIRELIGIEPFEDAEKRPGRVSYGVSSYGYDVRVGTRFKVFTNTTSGGAAVVVDILDEDCGFAQGEPRGQRTRGS